MTTVVSPAAPPDVLTVIDALRQNTVIHPHATAIIDGDRAVSYETLWRDVRRLALALRTGSVGRGARVGVAVDRSYNAIVSLLGVLRAGAAYVPLDPAYPAERLRFMVEDSGIRRVIGRSEVLKAFPQDLPVEFLHTNLALGAVALDAVREPAQPRATDLAYLIYTSGSSGRPKGVMVPHGALAAAARSLIDCCEIVDGDRILSFASMSWDTAGEEIYGALLAGATLVIDPRATGGSVPALLNVVARQGVTVIDLPTSFWAEVVDYLLLDDEPVPPSLRMVIVGGEEVRAAQVRAWSHRVPDRVRLLNTYGQTETVLVTHAAQIGGEAGRRLGDEDRVPIGTALAHITDAIVDDGSGTGELWVSGPSLAWGYRNRAGLTAQRFVAGAGERAYRTGDVVRRNRAGLLEFIGRADRQLKINGQRVEPEELERALLAQPGIRAAAAFGVTSLDGRMSLAAVYVGPGRSTTEVMAALRNHLPRHVLPRHLRAVDALPLLPNGKVDHVMLRQSIETPQPTRDPVTTVAELASAILGVNLGVDDDFFDAGGDSLSATRLLSRIYRAFDIELSFVDVFEHRTPRGIASLITRPSATGASGAGNPSLIATGASS